MRNESVIRLAGQLAGFRVRLKELHFGTPSGYIHRVLDDYTNELLEYEDSVMEDAQGVFGEFRPGQIIPELPRATVPVELLKEIREALSELLSGATGPAWTGIRSVTEAFWHETSKTTYLLRKE